jgi:hypothetical protein
MKAEASSKLKNMLKMPHLYRVNLLPPRYMLSIKPGPGIAPQAFAALCGKRWSLAPISPSCNRAVPGIMFKTP